MVRLRLHRLPPSSRWSVTLLPHRAERHPPADEESLERGSVSRSGTTKSCGCDADGLSHNRFWVCFPECGSECPRHQVHGSRLASGHGSHCEDGRVQLLG